MTPFRLIVATRNSGKLREIKACLSDLPIEVHGLSEYPEIGDIEEQGETFAANALHKARVVHAALAGWVLADDSGLACDDLGGAPGVYSARYAGPNATDDDNNRKLVEAFSYIHDPCRSARYHSAIALIAPDGREMLIEDSCEGLITMSPGGSGGFGYDPYFFLPELGRTMAELAPEEKNAISHRGKVLVKVRDYLKTQL